MKKCEICGNADEEVLITHHLDGDRDNSNPDNLLVVCANHHIKIHHRNFKSKNRAIIDLKAEIFNKQRLQEILYENRERDKKKANFYLDKLFHYSN